MNHTIIYDEENQLIRQTVVGDYTT